MKIFVRFLGLVIALSFNAAFAADNDSAQVWDDRLGELREAGPDEFVLTVVGDAIWTQKLSTNTGAGLQALFEVLRSADVTYLNLEQALTDQGFPMPNKDIVRADTSMIDEFVWAGTDIVSTANNHAMDFGADELQTTLSTLDSKGIKHSGAGATIADALRPTFIEVNGLKIALLSFMAAPDFEEFGIIAATENEAGVAPVRGAEVRLADGSSTIAPLQSDLQQMEEAIRNVREDADLVAVSLQYHWASDAVIDPGEELIARAAVDAGADMVLGHGSMRLNGIEFYKSKPILYSLGSFSLHIPQSAYTLFPTTLGFIKQLVEVRHIFESMAVRMIISNDGELRRMELLPIDKNDNGDPHLVAGEGANGILERVAKLSEPYGTEVEREAWYATVAVPEARD